MGEAKLVCFAKHFSISCSCSCSFSSSYILIDFGSTNPYLNSMLIVSRINRQMQRIGHLLKYPIG